MEDEILPCQIKRTKNGCQREKMNGRTENFLNSRRKMLEMRLELQFVGCTYFDRIVTSLLNSYSANLNKTLTLVMPF